jgi:restriction system protein
MDPKLIDIPYLNQFPEFKALRAGPGKSAVGTAAVTAVAEQTPEEAFESSYKSIRAAIEQELLLAQARNSRPEFFEQLVVDLLVRMG